MACRSSSRRGVSAFDRNSAAGGGGRSRYADIPTGEDFIRRCCACGDDSREHHESTPPSGLVGLYDCTATGGGGHSYYDDPPSAAVSFVDAEHAVTALINMISQPQELNSSAATFTASEAMHDVHEIYTRRWDHTSQVPFATIRAERAALRRTVDELRRTAVPVTAVNMEDRKHHHTEQPTVMQVVRPTVGSCTECHDGTTSSGDKARALTGPLKQMVELYPAYGFLDDDVGLAPVANTAI